MGRSGLVPMDLDLPFLGLACRVGFLESALRTSGRKRVGASGRFDYPGSIGSLALAGPNELFSHVLGLCEMQDAPRRIAGKCRCRTCSAMFGENQDRSTTSAFNT